MKPQTRFLLLSILIQFLIINSQLSAQQIPLNGTVSIQNSAFESADGKVEYVPNATIEDLYEQAQQATSNSDGEFTLTYIGVKEKEAVEYTVKKQGLEVVNARNGIVTSTLGQYAKVKIYMSSPEKLADSRKKYFQIGKTSLEQSLEKKLQAAYNERETLVAASNTDSEKLHAQNDIINRLLKEKEGIKKQAKELSEKFAEVNLDDQSENYQTAFRHFMKGEIDEALVILEEIDLEKRLKTNSNSFQKNEQIIEERQKSNETIQTQIQQDVEAVILKARIYKLKFQFAKAEKEYNLAIEYDSLNMNLLWEYAYYLNEQNQFKKAEKYYLQALQIAKIPADRANFLNNLGYLYSKGQELQKAEAHYAEALQIRRQLAQKNPNAFLPYVATTLNNLGVLFKSNQELQKAEAHYAEALQIYRQLAQKNPDAYV